MDMRFVTWHVMEMGMLIVRLRDRIFHTSGNRINS
jgi:hypothetical protein